MALGGGGDSSDRGAAGGLCPLEALSDSAARTAPTSYPSATPLLTGNQSFIVDMTWMVVKC